MSIELARIDDRLIHGQVMTSWVNYTNANKIVVIDDTTYVPLRSFAVTSGINLEWNNENNSARLETEGKVAEIVSKKSDERRNIFEEAAGISKYRHRKEESERKLKAVQDNLDRVKDILTELENRVVPLEKEAEKAYYFDQYLKN